jgi:very-short-patch-repair endonuclease
MSKLKTNQQFLDEVKQCSNSDEYEFLEEYKGTNTPIRVKHLICGYEYNVTPNTFLNKGCRCRKCALKKQAEGRYLTNEEFLAKVKELVGDEYTFLEPYKATKVKLKVVHNKCGYEYSVTPSNFIKGRRCPNCANNIKRTQEEFDKLIFDLVGDEYTFLEPYKNTTVAHKIRHNKCGYEYKVAPKDFIYQYRRCPKCVNVHNSMGVQLIDKFLTENSIDFSIEYKIKEFSDSKKFDFFIPLYNLLIEFDGRQHFIKSFNIRSNYPYNFNQQVLNDNYKNNYIYNNKHKLKLLRINYTNLKNINEILTNIFIEKEKRSSTIRHFNLLLIKHNKAYNYESYYESCNQDYFSLSKLIGLEASSEA